MPDDARSCPHCGAFVKGRTSADLEPARPRRYSGERRREPEDEPPLAIVTLILAVMGVLVCFPISSIAVITGHVARRQHPNMAPAHRVMNSIGMVIGGICLAVTLLGFLFIVFAVIAGS